MENTGNQIIQIRKGIVVGFAKPSVGNQRDDKNRTGIQCVTFSGEPTSFLCGSIEGVIIVYARPTKSAIEESHGLFPEFL
jgi:hypothetical protein